MKRMRLILAVTGIFLSINLFSLADIPQEKVPTFKQVLDLKSPAGPVISPEGNAVLFTIRETDWENNEYRRQIWRADARTGDIRQLTFSEKSSSSPRWSPDGKWITFLSARDKETQIHIMSASGGEARELTHSETGVSSYAWAPDSQRIAFTAPDKDTAREEREKKYGRFEVIDREYNVHHLWLVEVGTGKTDKLVDADDLHVMDMDWSPDGLMIAFSASPGPELESRLKSDIHVVTLSEKKVRNLVRQEGAEGNPVFSPDGKWLAFSTKMGRPEFFTNSRIVVVPSAGGEVHCLTGNFDESVSPEAWTGEGIYFTAFQGMASHIFCVEPGAKKIKRISSGEGMIIDEFSLSGDGKTMAFSYVDALHFPEVYVSGISPFSPRKLTDFAAQVKGWSLGTKEPVKWKSRDGAEITGVLMKPADFSPDRKYPLLVVIHGGPASISYPQHFDFYNRLYPLEQWLAKGAVILQPNYRGSSGFGEKFRSLNYRNLGVGDYWDVISGVDTIISQGFVDENRLGAMGWSQGGYISAFITAFSKRFKAVSVGAGISDWMTYYVNTDIHSFTRNYLGATPWDDPEIYRKTSPISYIKNACTPTLIQHGEFDQRVPTPNAFELYQGLSDMGVPVRLVIYKGFGHGLSKPKESLACLEHNFSWFNKHIWNEEPPESSELGRALLGK